MLRQKIEGGEVESPGENSIGTSTGSEKINKKEVKKKLEHFRDRQKLLIIVSFARLWFGIFSCTGIIL